MLIRVRLSIILISRFLLAFFFSVLNILLISLLVLIVADFLWKIRLILATRKFDGPFYVPVIGNAIILYTKQDGKKMDHHGIFH